MRLIIFDLDHTLIKANSSFLFGSFLYKKNFYSFLPLINCLVHYARYKWLGMSIAHLHASLFSSLFKGRSLETISNYVEQFLTESLDHLLYLPVIERLNKEREAGAIIHILSSSPDFLVKAIAKRLDVTDWKATAYLTDKKGNLTSIGSVMEGEEKANFLKKFMKENHISSSDVTVYSDSHLDLPLFNLAGQSIGVRPTSYLKRICLQKGWEIL